MGGRAERASRCSRESAGRGRLFFEDASSFLSYLVSMSLGQQGQQQQQGPVWIIIGVSFSVLTTASFPPKPSTMTCISRQKHTA